jgi:hypothetical protein
MNGLDNLGRGLLVTGAVLLVLGALLVLGGRIPWLGKLPGDVHIERERWSCSIPIVTSLLLSLLLTIVLNVAARILRK